jgi:hypothetical protein
MKVSRQIRTTNFMQKYKDENTGDSRRRDQKSRKKRKEPHVGMFFDDEAQEGTDDEDLTDQAREIRKRGLGTAGLDAASRALIKEQYYEKAELRRRNKPTAEVVRQMEQRLAEQEDDGEDDDYGMEEYGRDDNEIDAEE